MRKKVLIAGDTKCGKTALSRMFRTGMFSNEYEPTAFSNIDTIIDLHVTTVEFEIWDTCGEHSELHLRIPGYTRANTVLLCFSVDSSNSLTNITQQWMPEINQYCPKTPVLLVATKIDIRNDLNAKFGLWLKKKTIVINASKGRALAEEIQAYGYFECSAKTWEGVDNLFRYAVSVSRLN